MSSMHLRTFRFTFREQRHLLFGFLFLFLSPIALTALWTYRVPFKPDSSSPDLVLALLPSHLRPQHELSPEIHEGTWIAEAANQDRFPAAQEPTENSLPSVVRINHEDAPVEPQNTSNTSGLITSGADPALSAHTSDVPAETDSSFDRLRFAKDPSYENWLSDLRNPPKGTTTADRAWLLLQASQFPTQKAQVESVLLQEMLSQNHPNLVQSGEPGQIQLNAHDALVRLAANADEAFQKTQNAITAHQSQSFLIEGFKNQLLMRFPELAERVGLSPQDTSSSSEAPSSSSSASGASAASDQPAQMPEPVSFGTVISEEAPPPPPLPTDDRGEPVRDGGF